jgi:hypothetical protein
MVHEDPAPLAAAPAPVPAEAPAPPPPDFPAQADAAIFAYSGESDKRAWLPKVIEAIRRHGETGVVFTDADLRAAGQKGREFWREEQAEKGNPPSACPKFVNCLEAGLAWAAEAIREREAKAARQAKREAEQRACEERRRETEARRTEEHAEINRLYALALEEGPESEAWAQVTRENFSLGYILRVKWRKAQARAAATAGQTH